MSASATQGGHNKSTVYNTSTTTPRHVQMLYYTIDACSKSTTSLRLSNNWSSVFTQLLREQQQLSSCWDGRPFGHNYRHGPKIGGCAPFGGELGPHV